MNKLLVGSLLAAAVAQTAGCIIVDNTENQGTIGAAWNIKTNNAPVACPPGFDTARVVSRPSGNTDARGDIIDLFNCSTNSGITAPLPAGQYDVWVEIVNNSGTAIYATSTGVALDITNSDKDVSFDIHTDRGFYFMNWSLAGRTGGAPLTCATAGSPFVSLDASVPGNPNFPPVATEFDCNAGAGYSTALPAGLYTLSSQALGSTKSAIGPATTIADKPVEAPNRITNLGTVMLLVDGR